MTVDDRGNLGNLHIDVFAWEDVFQWVVVDHRQHREGHRRIVAQGTDPTPWYAEAAARQARRDLIAEADARTDAELAAKAKARARRAERAASG